MNAEPRHGSKVPFGTSVRDIATSFGDRDPLPEDDPAPYERPASGEEPGSSNEVKALIQVVVDIVSVLAVVAFCRLFVMAPFVIPSGSMENTLGINDRILTTNGITRGMAKPRRGDVIVFTDPGNWLDNSSQVGQKSDYLVKRLIGMPGDTVACKGSGYPVTVNGVALDEHSYLRPGVQPSGFPFEVTVKADHVFVMGDNRSNSADSRYHLDDSNRTRRPRPRPSSQDQDGWPPDGRRSASSNQPPRQAPSIWEDPRISRPRHRP